MFKRLLRLEQQGQAEEGAVGEGGVCGVDAAGGLVEDRFDHEKICNCSSRFRPIFEALSSLLTMVVRFHV